MSALRERLTALAHEFDIRANNVHPAEIASDSIAGAWRAAAAAARRVAAEMDVPEALATGRAAGVGLTSETWAHGYYDARPTITAQEHTAALAAARREAREKCLAICEEESDDVDSTMYRAAANRIADRIRMEAP